MLYRLYERHYKTPFCLFVLQIVFSVSAMEPAGYLLARLGKEIVSGAVASTSDVLLSEPLEYVKNMKQVKMKPSLDPRVWYRGAPVSLLSTIPTVMIQFLTTELLKDMLPGADFYAYLNRALIGGAISSTTATPAELIKLHLRTQDDNSTKKTPLEISRNLIAQNGLSGMMRSFSLKAVREAIFASGYLVVYQEAFAQAIQNGYAALPAVLMAASMTAAGVTLLSQPLDTLSTQMQHDHAKRMAATALQHARILYHSEGTKGFYRGTGWRFVSILLTMLSMGNVAMYIRERDARLMQEA